MEEVSQPWPTSRRASSSARSSRAPRPATAAGSAGFTKDFGHYRSDRLSAQALARWRAREVERVAGGEIKLKSFNNGYALLHVILAWARKPAHGYMKHNPLDGVDRIKVSAEERRLSERDFLQTDDIAALLAAVETAEEGAVVHLALFCGLRRGEIFALRWGDLEPGEGEDAGRVHVRRALSAGKVTGPKTGNSLRVVDAAPDVLAALDRHREANPPPAEGDPYVFCSAAGTPYDPDNWVKRVWTPLRKRAELRPTIGLHSLRHTFASLLIDQGENPKYVSRQLGHASPAFTLSVYAHCFHETSERAMGRLQGVIRAAKRRRFGVVAPST